MLNPPAATLVPLAPKIAPLVRMLASPSDGEIVAAARAIQRVLQSARLDLNDLGDFVERACAAPKPRPIPQWDRHPISDQLRAQLIVAEDPPCLSEWDRGFLESIASWRRPLSQRQRDTLARIHRMAEEYRRRAA